MSSFLIVFGILEAYFRLFNPQPIRPAIYRTHSIYGVSLIPGLRGYVKKAEYTHSFRLNSLGFRDIERKKLKPENTYRIIGLGDSFSWGAGVNQSDTFLNRLENSLNHNSKSKSVYYEVFNWGVDAWGTAQQLLCLKHQALAYNPDLMILQYFTGNDLTDNVYSNLFRVDEEGNLIRSSYGRKKITHIKKITSHIPFYRFLTQHSHLVNFIRQRLLMRVEKSDERNIATTLPANKFEYGLRLTKALLEEIFSTASKKRINVVLLVIPEKKEISSSPPGASPAPQKNFRAEDLMLAEVCRTHNVALLDLSEIFIQKNTSAIYYEMDRHLTSYGHNVVAEELEKFLKKNHLLYN